MMLRYYFVAVRAIAFSLLPPLLIIFASPAAAFHTLRQIFRYMLIIDAMLPDMLIRRYCRHAFTPCHAMILMLRCRLWPLLRMPLFHFRHTLMLLCHILMLTL